MRSSLYLDSPSAQSICPACYSSSFISPMQGNPEPGEVRGPVAENPEDNENVGEMSPLPAPEMVV